MREDGVEIQKVEQQPKVYDIKVPGRLAINLVRGITPTVDPLIAEAYHDMGAEGVVQLKKENRVVYLRDYILDRFDAAGKPPESLVLTLSKSDLRDLAEACQDSDDWGRNKIIRETLKELEQKLSDADSAAKARDIWQSLKKVIKPRK